MVVMPDIKFKPVAAAALLGLLFAAISFGLMASSRGVPAIFDGNETFSSILHARNLLEFGPAKAAGLADESTSPRPEGHSVVHTHQGNFPRLYASILSAIGLDSPASQVAATVLPVGIAAVFLLFWALRRHVSSGFAIVSVAILLTDYILFVQWQVVTYRLWQFLFTAALLATAVAYRERPRGWLLFAAFVSSLFLFYYELVFATFLATSISVFALLQWRRAIRSGLIFVGAQAAGALTGMALVIVQLINYLGWDKFIVDLRLTYISRNAGISDPAALAELRSFVEQNNIAFLYNFVDGSALRSPGFVLDSIFRWGFQVYTPSFAYCIVILAFAIAAALLARAGAARFPKFAIAGVAVMTVMGCLLGSSGAVFMIVMAIASLTIFMPPDTRRGPQHIGPVEAVMLAGLPVTVFVLMAATAARFPGFERAASDFWIYGAAFGTALAVLFVFLIARTIPQRAVIVPLDMALRGASVVCVALAFSQFHHRLYDGSLAPLWRDALPGSLMPASLQSLAMVIVSGCAAAIAAFGPTLPRQVTAPLREIMLRVGAMIGAFLIGLLVVIVLFPGYVFSGYMTRYLNLLVVPFALFIGFVFYAIASIATHFIANTYRAASPVRFPFAVRGAVIVLPVVLTAWWLAIQVANARLFPANGLAVLDALQAQPGSLKTVANSYPAPFAVTTGQWSYLDETFSSGRIVFSPRSGYAHPLDRKYLWFADRATNPEYDKPDSFICLLTPNYRAAALQIANPERVSRCADNGIVQWTQRNEPKTWPHHTIAARDPSGRDAWTIVKLDWDFPPFLTAEPKVTAAKTAGSLALTALYDFRQQEAKPEYRTDIEIWPVARNGSFCAVRGGSLAASAAKGGRTTLVLPESDVDTELIALVRPQTATRIGATFFTTPFRIGGEAVLTAGRPCGILRDAGGRHWSRIEGD